MDKTTVKLEKENGSYLAFSFNPLEKSLTVEKAAFIKRSDQDALLGELCRYIHCLPVMSLKCRSHFPLSFVKDLDCCAGVDEIVD